MHGQVGTVPPLSVHRTRSDTREPSPSAGIAGKQQRASGHTPALASLDSAGGSHNNLRHHRRMGKRGQGYGSEDHFLRYRADHRDEFDRLLLEALGAPEGTLEWVYPTGSEGEREPQGLEFLRDDSEVMTAWASFWPQRGRQQTWDGVARLRQGDAIEWVLIEAKANAVEFVTPPCGASEDGGLTTIERALAKVKTALGVHRHYPWTGTYYQYANRLAVLHFLNNIAATPAHLLHVYFTGDVFPDGRECPQDDAGWEKMLQSRDITLGLPAKHGLSSRCHTAFVPALKVGS